MGTAAQTYTISELAEEFDLTTRAIRFYEDMGLLHPDRAGASGKQRIYSAKDRTRLRLTLRAKRLGLSLQEAKEILDLYESPRDTHMQLNRFVQVLSAQRARLQGQLADLQANLAEIDEHLREAQDLLRVPAEKK